MREGFKEVKAGLGGDLSDVVLELWEHRKKGELVYTDFNGTIFYSDTVTMDGAYKEITGKTKAEFDSYQKAVRENWKRLDEEHKASIPMQAEIYKKRARGIIAEDKLEYWDEIVPIRLGDLYKGMELGSCLEIVETLNNGGSLDDAKEKIYNQGHSGMSFGLVCAMVKHFSDRGKEFVDYVN